MRSFKWQKDIMRIIYKKGKYEIESQVVNKMFREDKQYRTKIIPNKKKEHKNERCKENQRKHRFPGLQFESWET
jgi:hypothetical protein